MRFRPRRPISLLPLPSPWLPPRKYLWLRSSLVTGAAPPLPRSPSSVCTLTDTLLAARDPSRQRLPRLGRRAGLGSHDEHRNDTRSACHGRRASVSEGSADPPSNLADDLLGSALSFQVSPPPRIPLLGVLIAARACRLAAKLFSLASCGTSIPAPHRVRQALDIAVPTSDALL